MHCNAILKGNKCLLKLFFTKSSKKFCEKIETPLENPRRILVPPFGTCEETATPLEILRPQHMFLTPPLGSFYYVCVFFQS